MHDTVKNNIPIKFTDLTTFPVNSALTYGGQSQYNKITNMKQ